MRILAEEVLKKTEGAELVKSPSVLRKHFLHPRGYLINLIVLRCSI